MTAKILENFGNKIAERWAVTVFTPAFVFWLGGFVITIQHFGWQFLVKKFTSYPESLQIAILVGGLCAIAVSAFVVQRFDVTTLRFLEGYWYPWLRSYRIEYYRRRKQNLHKKRNSLRKTEAENKRIFEKLKTQIETHGVDILTSAEKKKFGDLYQQLLKPDEQIKLIQLIQELRMMPADTELMPTRLGNLLRAFERKPLEKYGLDAVICWSRLWLLLPDAAKKEVQIFRSDLNAAARIWLWSILFTLWTLLGAWWAAPLGIIFALFAYYNWAIPAAISYGELIEATFDLYRHLLYDSLRWNLPPDPNEERRVGRELTKYLYQGF